jgi:putative SOS response-associated peptidase YedK
MCYYNGVKVTREEFIRLKQLEKAVAKYDFLNRDLLIGFEYGHVPVLKRTDGAVDFDIVEMEWGFLPSYIRTREDALKMRMGYKDSNGAFKPPMLTLNAVSEELLLPNKIYRQAALERRCLVLSTGFYEWRHVFPKNKRTGLPVKTAVKYPYHITVRDKGYFYMAGIWQAWTDKATGETVDTVSIVTTKANSLMAQIHNTKQRMPTILTEDLGYEWLLGDLSEERITEIATTQLPSEQMDAITIAKDFRAALEPTAAFEYEGLEALTEES